MKTDTFLRAWSPMLEQQAIARSAASMPLATPQERVRSVARHTRIRMWRARQHTPKIILVEGLDNGLKALPFGPCILTFPHVGIFEGAAQLLDKYFPERHQEVTVIGDDIKSLGSVPRILHDRYGWKTTSIYDDDCGTIAQKALYDGGIVAVSSDVCPDSQLNHAVQVEFLKQWCLMPSGPAFLAEATGAVILPLAAYLVGNEVNVRINPPIWLSSNNDNAALTQEISDVMTDLICAAPDQWYPPFPIRKSMPPKLY